MSESARPSVAYRVLARKYRPATFSALIGQDAVVRTLANAIARDRIAHAFLLTGVRGVGKTSTARLLARSLNCVGPDGTGGPTVDTCGVCEPCVAIAESRHIDVLEMDAASHTGVDDVREIIETGRYAAVSARYKVYIIDEVHMLSRNAFNALLKTLEEPPAHVKFIFATTEVAKLPVTVLSRCQRFDLKRVPADRLLAHYRSIAEAEQVEAEDAALALIAQAAEGSVRDGLSILDQAIVHGAGRVEAAAVREMLGLADRGLTRQLMGALLEGDAPAALAGLRQQYELGSGPETVVRALLDLTYAIMRAKVGDAEDAAADEQARAAVARWAEALTMPLIHRLWQLLLKGLAEVETAPSPLQAAEMLLLRIVHLSSLPDPGELVRRLEEADPGQGALPVARPPSKADLRLARPAEAAPASGRLRSVPPDPGTPAPVAPDPVPPGPVPSEAIPSAPPASPAPAAGGGSGEGGRAVPPAQPIAASASDLPASFEALVTLCVGKGEHRLGARLHDEVRLVRYEPPHLEIAAAGTLPADFPVRLGRCLSTWTGVQWSILLRDNGSGPTLAEQAEAAREAERRAILDEPMVRSVLSAFPGAELLDFGTDEARAGG